MNSESVDLIATDPPFNKGRDFHATPDSLAKGARFQDRWTWKKDVHPEWVDQLRNDHPKLIEAIDSARHAHSEGMGAYICFMSVRLLEMRRVLKQEGSIYLHCDQTASHYLKAVMDAIFGFKNFVNHIIWRRAIAHNDAERFGNITDHILLYSRNSERMFWNGRSAQTPKSETEIERAYPRIDTNGNRYRSQDLTGAGATGAESIEPWKNYDIASKGRHWAPPKTGGYADYIERKHIPEYKSITGVHARLNALDKAGLIIHPQHGFWPGLKRYAEADQGVPPQNLILDPVGFTNFNKGKEATGYATQKPIALYELLLRSSSKEGDIVLDPFAGCATTCVAAEGLGRQWVGIDIWDRAHETVVHRLRNLTGVLADVHYSKVPPDRTDFGETAASFLTTISIRLEPKEPWQKLTRDQITDELCEAQKTSDGKVLCAGCGRDLEKEFMQLDHIQPRSEGGVNDISNRILLCSPCNNRKSDQLTIKGLWKKNKKEGWTLDENKAKLARERAKEHSNNVRVNLRELQASLF